MMTTLKWQVGDVKITRIVESELPISYSAEGAFLKEATPEKLRDMPWLYPHFVTEAGELKLSIHALLVEAPGLKLVVDTCVGNDKPRAMFGKLQTGFLESFEATGCKRSEVNAVVCTHLHVDH